MLPGYISRRGRHGNLSNIGPYNYSFAKKKDFQPVTDTIHQNSTSLRVSSPLRRAHLKECFETLKKNVPNVDEKKTSNLSVLRSALRYIQVQSDHPPHLPQPPGLTRP